MSQRTRRRRRSAPGLAACRPTRSEAGSTGHSPGWETPRVALRAACTWVRLPSVRTFEPVLFQTRLGGVNPLCPGFGDCHPRSQVGACCSRPADLMEKARYLVTLAAIWSRKPGVLGCQAPNPWASVVRSCSTYSCRYSCRSTPLRKVGTKRPLILPGCAALAEELHAGGSRT